MRKNGGMTEDRPEEITMPERLPVRFWDVMLPLLALIAAIILLVGAMVGVTFALQRQGSVSGVRVAMGALYLAMFVAIWRVARKRGPVTVSGYFGPFRLGQFAAGAVLG